MTTTQPNTNQFAMSTVRGQLDLLTQGTVISCQVDSAQAVNIQQGEAVKLATTAGGVPKVISLAANADVSFGFACRNLKDVDYPASSYLEVAMINSVMTMEAGAAITRGAKVEVVYTTRKVITNAGTNPVVGFALDTAANSGDLIRVYIITQSYQSAQVIADIAGLQDALDAANANADASVQTISVTASLAQINAGLTLIAGVGGKAITVLDYTARVNGSSFAGGTNIILESTNGTPVVVSTIAEAALASGAINKPTTANNVLGVGFSAPLGTSDGVKVVSTGTHTTATGITFTFTYQQV